MAKSKKVAAIMEKLKGAPMPPPTMPMPAQAPKIGLLKALQSK